MSGLEIVGAVASIAQLAATVYGISKTLYEVSDALSNAPSDIQDLARDLETFSQELNLLYKLLGNKNSRYSDEVHRLMAKIIGDCAMICVKIDTILRKLRTGSVMARIKWVFKEKEIVKLLTRLRDLKLSLLHVLSMSHTFEADAMMDALKVHNPSLLVGNKNEQLSKETMDEVEATRRKLAGLSVGQGSDTNSRRPASTLTSESSQASRGSSQSNLTDETRGTSISVESSSSKTPSVFPLTSATASMSSGTVTGNPMPFISTMAIPRKTSGFQITQAMLSAQSFHSAASYLEPDGRPYQNTSEGSPKATEPTGVVPQPSKNQSVTDHERWKADMVASTMKRFNISHSSAEEWVSTLHQPALVTNVQDVEMDFSMPNPIPSPLSWYSEHRAQSGSTNQNLAFTENGAENLQAQPNPQVSSGLTVNQAAQLASPQKMRQQQQIHQQQQQMQIQYQRAQAARQAMLAQQYTGIQPGMPNGMSKMTQVQSPELKRSKSIVPHVTSPENIQQQQQQQQAQLQLRAPRLQAQAKFQHISLMWQARGMGPVPIPPQQSPAMNTLNRPMATPSQPINHQNLPVNQQRLSGINSVIMAQMSPDQQQRLMNPENYAAKQMMAAQEVPLSSQQSAQNHAFSSHRRSISSDNEPTPPTYFGMMPQHLELELEQRCVVPRAIQNPRSKTSGRKRAKTGCLSEFYFQIACCVFQLIPVLQLVVKDVFDVEKKGLRARTVQSLTVSVKDTTKELCLNLPQPITDHLRLDRLYLYIIRLVH